MSGPLITLDNGTPRLTLAAATSNPIALIVPPTTPVLKLSPLSAKPYDENERRTEETGTPTVTPE